MTYLNNLMQTTADVTPFSLTMSEACKYSGLSLSTLYKAVREGLLPMRKVGGRSLVLRSDVEAFVLSGANWPGRKAPKAKAKGVRA